MIKVITDSTSDIPVEQAAALGIEVLPIYVVWEGRSFRDGIDMTPDDFYRKLITSAVLPTTSQPTQADFEAAYIGQEGKYDGIVSIHISAKLSGTYHAAMAAAAMVRNRIAVQVIDSRFNSIGLGLVSIAAARTARAGATLDTVVQEAHKAITQVKMLGIFDTLKYTIAGGRINKSLGRIASVLNIKPLMTFRNGEVALSGAVRVYSKGVDRIAEFVRKNMPLQDLGIVHSAAHAEADKLRRRLADILPAEKIIVNQLGASLGVHGGPGILLVALRTA